MNEEFPVSASHKLALITSLPFVHTARRYYRLDDLVRTSDWLLVGSNLLAAREDVQTVSSRGSKSRNKVSVGEPAEGSLPFSYVWCIGEKRPAGFSFEPRVRQGGFYHRPPGPSIGIRSCCTCFCTMWLSTLYHFFSQEKRKKR